MKNLIKTLATLASLVVMVFMTSCGQQGIPIDVKTTLDKYVEYWNTGQFEGIENVLCEDYELLESPEYKPQVGIEPFKQYILKMRSTFPDFHLVIDERIYEKDKVAGIWSITATHSGPGKIPPTGKLIQGKGISVIHFKDGKIKDEWIASNDLLWLIQMGYTIIPPETDSVN